MWVYEPQRGMHTLLKRSQNQIKTKKHVGDWHMKTPWNRTKATQTKQNDANIVYEA